MTRDARALRVLVADDEEVARRRIRRLLSAIEGVEIVAECASGEDALAQLDRLDVDLALLDVRMGARSGLDVADAAAELGVEIVFTTAHADHAVAAFARGAADYVLKPIEAERLGLAIARARERIAHARADSSGAVSAGSAASSAGLDRIAIESRGELRLVPTGDISHAIVDGELVTVWAGGEAIVTELTLSDLARRLPAGAFERVHRRALLQLGHVDRLRPLPTGGYLAITRDGQEVPVSRQAARALRRRLGIG
jgi:two-component system LytT family response regulator